VLEAAARLFGARGFDCVTTSEIAAQAGVADGTVFHHFGSKQGLLLAVAEQYGRGLSHAMFGEVDTTQGFPDVEQMIRRGFDYVGRSDPLFGLYLLSDEPLASGTARPANRQEIVDALTTRLTHWKAAGVTRDLDPRLVAELCFALVEAALRQCFVYGHGQRREEYIAEVVGAIRALTLVDAGRPH